jgi:hypothetical protein
VSPPHRLREDGLTRPTDTSISNLAPAGFRRKGFGFQQQRIGGLAEVVMPGVDAAPSKPKEPQPTKAPSDACQAAHMCRRELGFGNLEGSQGSSKIGS